MLKKNRKDSPSIRDKRLLKGLRRGDVDALDHVWHIYHRRVYGFHLRMCWNSVEAASLTEESFAVLWRGAMLVADEIPFDVTIYRIARNVFVEHETELTTASQPRVSGNGNAVGGGASTRLGVVQSPIPAKLSGRKARQANRTVEAAKEQALGAAMLSLGTDSHMVFVLLVFQGLTPSQVGLVMGMSEQEVLEIACDAEAQARKSLTPVMAGKLTP